MIPKPFRFLLTAAVCLTAAHAQSDRTFSLTLSPLHLAMPVFELTGEYALSPKTGVAAIGGYGSTELKYTDGTSKDIPVLELGAQAMYYVWGDFEGGMQVGAELLWLKLFVPEDEGVEISANGVAIGPLVGYKWVLDIGLTFDVQAGYQFLFAQAKAENAAGEEAEASGETGIPLLNVNAGWSF